MVSKPHTRCLAIAVILAFALPTLATARTWHVPTDAPTIQAGIDSAGVGDDVLVAPGTYFEHDIVMKAGITVHSAQGPDQTTVNATGAGVGFMCVDQEELATLEGFTVLNGLAEGWDQDGNSGGGVKCVDSDIVIRNCDIIDCVAHDMGGGVYAWASNVEIDECKVIGCSAYQFAGIAAFGFDSSRVAISDCEIRGNTSSMGVGGVTAWGGEAAIIRCLVSGNGASWGGVGGIGCDSPMYSIRDCVVVDNWVGYEMSGTGGIFIGEDSAGSISGCTVVRNAGVSHSAVRLYYGAELDIDRTIIAFNRGAALICSYAEASVQCCDFFGNDADDLCGTDLGGNFTLDPLFCDHENGDYTLDGCSPCLPGNHPDGVDCGLIGALGQGCGATAVEETSWGRIKAGYREWHSYRLR